MNSCELCKAEIPINRTHCHKCLRKLRWPVERIQTEDRLFPPRIVQCLNTLGDKVNLRKLDLVEQGLFLYGPAGTGKTIYAAAILMEMKRLSYLSGTSTYVQGAFVNTLNLLGEIKSTFSNNGQQAEVLIEKYSSVDVLILDDLGMQKSTEWVLETLMLIINNRYENLKSTIITSNLNLEELAAQLGDDRIPSRIYEMCKLHEFRNDDWRIKGGLK